METSARQKLAILTIGPQGAGKSTFCEEILRTHPEILSVSRDKILMELFGDVFLSPYTGGHEIGYKVMWERVADCLTRDETTLILDCWNGPREELKGICDALRSLGVRTVGGWYFVTPEDACLAWRMKKVMAEPAKEDPKWERFRQNSARDGFLEHFRFFHSHPVDLSHGLDFLVKIDPLNPPPFDALFR